MEHFRGSRGEMDAFGNGSNTQAHKINQVLTTVPQTISHISSKSKVQDRQRVQRQLDDLVKKGYAIKDGNRYALTNTGPLSYNTYNQKLFPDASRDEFLKAFSRFDKEMRNQLEWSRWTDNLAYKYAIFYQHNLYPVKTIVSLANCIPVQQFSGVNQANTYVTNLGFRVINLRAFSWTIESGTIACKFLDKSAFLHRGTCIPLEIRPFFLEYEISPGEKRDISLVHGDQTYSAHIDFESTDTARTRLFWNSNFTSLLKSTFPYHYQQYSQGLKPISEIVIRFNRVSGYEEYQVTFAGEIAADTASSDIQADELEDRGPQKEGSVKEYFGKRYERSPINRKLAIQLHGLACNVCGFNFEAVYGARGTDYIEVHHVKPISTFTEEQHVDPKTDLMTICSNCHRMIHRQPNDILTVEQLRNIIQEMKEDV